jgi:hypothetical protein
LLPDKVQQNALYVFIVTKVNRKNISNTIVFFFFHVGAGNIVISLFLGLVAFPNSCIWLLKTQVRELVVVYKWMPFGKCSFGQ